MAVTLDRIIGEFWCGYACTDRWKSIENWPEIIADARRRSVAFAIVLEMIQVGAQHESTVYPIVSTIAKIFDETAAWFFGPHDSDWLGTIPADILGIVCNYLRVRHEGYGKQHWTTALGVYHSFNDEPSHDNRNCGHTLSWYRGGERWRIGGRPTSIFELNARVELHWPNRKSIVINLETGRCCYEGNIEITSEEIIEEVKRECWRAGIDIDSIVS